MPFQIQGLKPHKFVSLFSLSDDELSAQGAVRMVAQSDSGFPCRISLKDAKDGECVILVHYQHQSADTPYRASAAIFVRENAQPAKLEQNEIPQQLRDRVISGRAFDKDGMMVDADVCDGKDLQGMIEQLLNLPGASYLQLHYAKHGCYAARVERAD